VFQYAFLSVVFSLKHVHTKKRATMYTQHMFGLTCVFCAKVSLFSLVHVEQKLYLCNIILGNASTASYWKTIKKTHLIMLIIIAIICLLCILVAERQFFAAQRCHAIATTPRFSPSIAKGFHRRFNNNSS
jgi:ABC-type Mn2+/Zn2+ transport system permease subunit